MKKIHLFLLGTLFSAAVFAQDNDPVVLTIEGEQVRASEFLYIYLKNNDNPSFQKDSLDSYMQLFINYKLKVKAALDAKYDTIPRLKSELEQYRKQLSMPYLTDEKKNEKLIEEAYQRTITEVRASHILIRLGEDPSPKDTVAAYGRCLNLRNRILAGESFADVATGPLGSEDPSVKMNGGDLGYFTALQMVYPFEAAAFKMNIGDVSMPVRTKFGYHLIYLADKRPSKGMIETAHILITTSADAEAEELAKAEQKINEIYAKLQAGESFEDLAVKYSDDQSSKAKGGLLPIFGSGAKQRMIPDFETAAYALTSDGAYSKPFKTTFGYHIVKRIQLMPVPSYEALHRELKLRVERDIRSETTRASFIEDLKKSYNYTTNAPQLMGIFSNTVGDEIFFGKWKGLKDHSHDADILFEFKDNLVTIGEFEQYILAKQTKTHKIDKDVLFMGLMDKMVEERILAYEDTQLERKYPEFKSLMQEYANGILVFEIMQDEIWKKASKDTAGIRAYYEAHRAAFLYPIRYDGDLFSCNTKATAKGVTKLLKAGVSVDDIVKKMSETSQLNVKVKSQIFNSETTEAFQIKKKGNVSTKIFTAGINKVYVNEDVYYVFGVKEVLAAREREFSEAKGLVTAAYQNQMEAEWLAQLRKKYSIQINEEVLHSLKATK